MKKFSFFAAIALITLFSACGGKNTTPEAPKPAPQQEAAAKITIPKEAAVPMELNVANLGAVTVDELEFMRGGSYFGNGRPKKNNLSVAPRGTEPVVYFSGTFTMVGETYKLDGDVKADISVTTEAQSTTITVQEEGAAAPTVIGDAAIVEIPEPDTDVEKALCVSWKIAQVDLAIDSPAVKHKFTGADASSLGAMAEYANSKLGQDQQLDVQYLSDFVIKSVNISTNPKDGNKVTVNFVKTGVQPVVGIWQWNKVAQDMKFIYDLKTEVKGKFFDGHAEGTIDFPNGNYNKLVLSVVVKANDMSGKIILTCDRIN